MPFPCNGGIINTRIDISRSSTPSSTAQSEASTSSRTDLAEGENAVFSLHPCVVLCTFQRRSHLPDSDHWSLFVLVCRSYRDEPNPVEFVANKEDGDRDMHIPLPPPKASKALVTPSLFGDPLSVDMVPKEYLWVIAEIRQLKMGRNGS